MTANVSIAIYNLTLKEKKNKENILQTREKMQGFIQNTLFKKTAIYKHPPLQKSNLFKFSYEQCSGEITSLKPGSIHIFTLLFFCFKLNTQIRITLISGHYRMNGKWEEHVAVIW